MGFLDYFNNRKVQPEPKSDAIYNQTILDSSISFLEAKIKSWKDALALAQSPTKSKFNDLQIIYRKLARDTQLHMVMNKLVLSLQSDEYTFKEDIKDKQWFFKLIKMYVEGLFFGNSIIEVTELDEAGLIKDITVLPRNHINPMFKYFQPDVNIEKYVDYTEEPYIFEVYSDDFYRTGLMDMLAPIIIFYNIGLKDYVELLDRYSTPTKVIKTTATENTKNINRLHQMMSKLSRNSYCILRKEEEIEFIQSANIQKDIFTSLFEHVEAKISKAVFGSVIGEASQGGSRSKEEVGERVENTNIEGYKKGFEFWVNDYLVPKLEGIGYTFSESEMFKYAEVDDTEQDSTTPEEEVPEAD